MARIIRFSVPDDIVKQLSDLSEDESPDLVAKRILLDFLRGTSQQDTFEEKIEQKLLELEQRLTKRIDKIEILFALKTEIDTGNLRPSANRTNK